MSERRFRADTRFASGQALCAVVRHARVSEEEFFYGPDSFDRIESEGLLVSGPGADGAAVVLAQVPGVSEVDAETGLPFDVAEEFRDFSAKPLDRT